MLELARIMLAGHIAKLQKNEQGATGVEYGLLVGLIAAVMIATVVILGQKLPGGFQTVINQI